MSPTPHALLALFACFPCAHTGGFVSSPAGLAGRGSAEVRGVSEHPDAAPAKVVRAGPATAGCGSLEGQRSSLRGRMERDFHLPACAGVFPRGLCRYPDPGARTMELSAVTNTLEVRNGDGTPAGRTGRNEGNC